MVLLAALLLAALLLTVLKALSLSKATGARAGVVPLELCHTVAGILSTVVRGMSVADHGAAALLHHLHQSTKAVRLAHPVFTATTITKAHEAPTHTIDHYPLGLHHQHTVVQKTPKILPLAHPLLHPMLKNHESTTHAALVLKVMVMVMVMAAARGLMVLTVTDLAATVPTAWVTALTEKARGDLVDAVVDVV